MLRITSSAGLGRLIQHLGERALKPRDAGVFLALMAHTDTFTGRIHVSANQIAADLNSNPSEVRAAIARLKQQHLLRSIVDPISGNRYYLLNPWVVQSGKPQAVGLAMKEFQEA